MDNYDFEAMTKSIENHWFMTLKSTVARHGALTFNISFFDPDISWLVPKIGQILQMITSNEKRQN